MVKVCFALNSSLTAGRHGKKAVRAADSERQRQGGIDAVVPC